MAYVVTGYWDAGYVTSDSEAKLTAALQEVAPGAIIELFQLQLNLAQHGVSTTYYFHAGVNQLNTDVVWNGQAYIPLPVEADGFEWNGQGSLPRPKIRVSNIAGSITTILSTLTDGLEGAKVTRIRTLGRYLDAVNFTGGTNPTADPYAEWPREVYYVDRKSIETRDVVEFELSSAFDLVGVRSPKRQCVSRCQWRYRGDGCGYSGTNYFKIDGTVTYNSSEDVCAKSTDACKLRFGEKAELPYGGFPGINAYYT